MKSYKKTTYECEHCHKLYKTKQTCINHEARCYRNEKNRRPCYTCAHCVKKTAITMTEYANETILLFCNAKDTYVSPSYVDPVPVIGTNVTMPVECDFHIPKPKREYKDKIKISRKFHTNAK